MLTKNDEDAQEAWVLRAGAELWKAVVAEADYPAGDTQKALAAVRAALDCARRLRHTGDISETDRQKLEAECAQSTHAQMLALRQWGQGRSWCWDEEWGTHWGEALLPEETVSGSSAPRPAEAAPCR